MESQDTLPLQNTCKRTPNSAIANKPISIRHNRYSSLEEATKFWHADRIIEDINRLKAEDPGSRVYHLTVTFRPSRFVSRRWSGATGRDRDALVTEAADEMFQNFRYWWIGGLQKIIPNFNRRTRLHLQPRCWAFIDDRSAHEPYPHIHSAVFVPSATIRAFDRWFIPSGSLAPTKAELAWWPLEESGTVYLEPADTSDEHVGNVVGYASKYVRKVECAELWQRRWLRSLSGGSGPAMQVALTTPDALMRRYPDFR